MPDNISKQFNDILSNVKERKKNKFYETKEEKMKRIKQQLGINEHGKGKRKKRNKKKGGCK